MNSLLQTHDMVAMPADFLPPGAMAGPWRVEHELGRGGMGAVYAVVHAAIGKRAALKVIHQALFAPFGVEHMRVEACVVNLVGHPNIVDIFETGRLDDGRPYIVMERLDGHSLAARVALAKLSPDTAIEILLQICGALIAAHAAGVIHCDLKTANVFLVDGEPTATRVKLLDWGVATEISGAPQTTDGTVLGTPEYLAPEQVSGAVVTDKTDVYSLGVLAYELFTARLPFVAASSRELMAMHLHATPPLPQDTWPNIPRALQHLLLAMLAKSPELRPDMREVARCLDEVRQDSGCRMGVESPTSTRQTRPEVVART